ncbi:hypothetical protein DF186_13865, partial [Enterococcus hirae]
IDVQQGEIILRVNDDEFKLNAVKVMQYSDILKDCMKVDIIDFLVEEINMAESFESEFEDIFKDVQSDQEELEEVKEFLKIFQEEDKFFKSEFKLLLLFLKYVFLGEGDIFSVIISSVLELQEEEVLI